jgi:hypothetical protein
MTSKYGDINYATVKVHVPNGKSKFYRYTDEWKRFWNISDDYTAQIEKLIKTVNDLIDAIGKIEYSYTCKNKINAARSAYNALSTDQQALVKNYNLLLDAEKEYQQLEEKATSISDITTDSVLKDGKYLKNGKIVIIKNGKKYTVTGLRK